MLGRECSGERDAGEHYHCRAQNRAAGSADRLGRPSRRCSDEGGGGRWPGRLCRRRSAQGFGRRHCGLRVSGSVALVRVHALPLRPDGCVDDNTLAALPAWSEASLPPTAVYRQIAPLRPRIHLADLLPDYPLLKSTIQETPVSRTPAHGAADKPAVSRLRPLPAQPQMPGDLAEALERAAQHPELGIVHVTADMSEIRVSYAELFDQARRILGGLRTHDVRSGDVVLVDATDSRSLLPLFWACILGAMVPAPFKLAAAAAGGASLNR